METVNSLYNRRGWARYILATEDGGEYSAAAGDYWDARDDTVIGDLVRVNHVYVTRNHRAVTAARLLRSNVTVRQLRRLERARRSVVQS